MIEFVLKIFATQATTPDRIDLATLVQFAHVVVSGYLVFSTQILLILSFTREMKH